MSARNKTSPALDVYLALPPEGSLILLTSTLGCSANWITARFGAVALGSHDSGVSLIIASWLRSEGFWRDQIRRAAGIDIARLSASASYQFLHFLPDASTEQSQKPADELRLIEQKVLEAIARNSETTRAGKVVLVLDVPDVLLAINPSINALALSSLLLTLRGRCEVHATILSCVGDLPLTNQDDRIPTHLESENAAFLFQQAHLASMIMSVRELETGAARDVSGVLRITRGGRHATWDGHGELKELEKLYLAQRDGAVKLVE